MTETVEVDRFPINQGERLTPVTLSEKAGPWHGAHFNVKTGAVTVPPAPSGVRSFPVKVEGSDVLVEVD